MSLCRVECAAVDAQSKLFRFLDFTKYASMLDQRALFFTRADQLADPFEGSIPVRFSARVRKRESDELKRLRRSVLLNCWHANEHESAAMWRIYLKSDEGVAIETTVARIENAFRSFEGELYLGAVRYLDYARDGAPGCDEVGRFFCKRKPFDYENEVRIVMRSSEPHTSPGRYVAVDLDALVERVVVSPSAEPWFEDLVRSVTKSYGLDFRIESSELGREP